jgi:NAD(P)-dependent dehydrogenase (short-subunit alcohol dehydrogenase family)
MAAELERLVAAVEGVEVGNNAEGLGNNEEQMMTWTAADIPEQGGRVAVVTGSNTGLGLEVATRLAEHDAIVVLACRNSEKAERAAAGIRAQVSGARVELGSLDLASLTSVAAFADWFSTHYDRLDLLINNAGLMAVDQSRTEDGFESQFQVNYLGAFALTQCLRLTVEATPGARVATMSSAAHRPGRIHFDDLNGDHNYKRWRAYMQSKVANLLFTLELQRQFVAGSSDSIAVAAHPGFTFTELGNKGRNQSLSNRFAAAAMTVCQSIPQGALPMLRAATDPAVRGGEFYGPRFHITGPPVLEKPARRARNSADAHKLWEISTALVRHARQ